LVALIKLPGIIWQHVLQPMAKSVVEVGTISELSRVAPDLIKLSRMASVLDEIAQQFKTDSGSSLRDVLNRLESVTEHTSAAVEMLQRTASAPAVISKAKVEASDLLAAADEAAAELMAVATRAAAQLKALAKKETGQPPAKK
jgi:DNA repair ATPase RecN